MILSPLTRRKIRPNWNQNPVLCVKELYSSHYGLTSDAIILLIKIIPLWRRSTYLRWIPANIQSPGSPLFDTVHSPSKRSCQQHLGLPCELTFKYCLVRGQLSTMVRILASGPSCHELDYQHLKNFQWKKLEMWLRLINGPA